MAFLKGQWIYDAINLTQEFTHPFNNVEISRHAFTMNNFFKAFDMLRWDSIDVMLENLGFDEVFRELVMNCVKSPLFQPWWM